MKLWLPKQCIGFKRAEFYPVLFEEPKDKKLYVEVEVPEVEICRECMVIKEECWCDSSTGSSSGDV